jgi:hypothetical protein
VIRLPPRAHGKCATLQSDAAMAANSLDRDLSKARAMIETFWCGNDEPPFKTDSGNRLEAVPNQNICFDRIPCLPR